MQPIFPGEGTRKTPAPVTNSLLQGTGETSAEALFPTYTYAMRDRENGDLYEVHIEPLSINAQGLIVYNTASFSTITPIEDTDEFIFDALRMNNHWLLYVASGSFRTWKGPFAGEILEGSCDFGDSPDLCTITMTDLGAGDLYTVDFSVDPPNIVSLGGDSAEAFDAVEINSGWYLVLVGEVVFSTTRPTGDIFSNDCIKYTVNVTTGEQTGGPDGDGGGGGSGGGGGGGVTPIPPITVDCPDTSIDDLTVDFTAPAVSGIVTNYHWNFGDGEEEDTGATTTVSHTYTEYGAFNVVLTVVTTTSLGVSQPCPIELVQPDTCPDVFGGFEDARWSVAETGTGTFVDRGNMNCERAVTAGGLTNIEAVTTIDSSEWGDCGPLSVRLFYDLEITAIGGGIPGVSFVVGRGGVTYFEEDQTGSVGHKSGVLAFSEAPPYVGILSITTTINGSCSGYARVRVDEFSLAEP